VYDIDLFISDLERRNPSEPEFIQAVREVLESVIDVVNETPMYRKSRILERITEPDRVFSFKVEWEDDSGTSRSTEATECSSTTPLGPTRAACVSTRT